MPLYQNTAVDTDKLVIGNYMIFGGTITTAINTYLTVTSIESTLTNIGAGIINSFGHNVEKYDVQAGNAPDPIEGIASETFTIAGELIEYDGTKLAAVMGGLVTSSASSGSNWSVVTGGGLSEITPKTFVLVNRRIVAGTSVLTMIYLYKGTFVNGPQFTAKSDNDTDPINTMSFEIQGEIDGNRTAGDQLYSIRKWKD
jgi:roadblock/LC7 domain-containing protein